MTFFWLSFTVYSSSAHETEEDVIWHTRGCELDPVEGVLFIHQEQVT
tara:strand:+ start:526 stop:666 length:141 start_codon:yes stop_codon:yes gene_type:complete